MSQIIEQDTEKQNEPQVIEATSAENSAAPAPHVPDDKRQATQGNMPKLLLAALGLFLVLLLLVFGLSSKGRQKAKKDGKQRTMTQQTVNQPNSSVTPADQMTPKLDQQEDTLSAQDIERTKDPQRNASPIQANQGSPLFGAKAPQGADAKKSAPNVEVGNATGNDPKQLGSIPPFQQPNFQTSQQQWSPQPYNQQAAGQQQPPAQPVMTQDVIRDRKEQVTKASLLFTRKAQVQQASAATTTHGGTSGSTVADFNNFGLRPGFHVALRLEAVASTGVLAPVTATVEYNYTRDGKILIPAGSRAIGKVDGADGSGHINISFTSLELPDGYAVPISAIGLDTSMQQLKGTVTGRQRGKAMLISTLSGIGQTAAMLVGTNTSAAYSQNDMMRQRIAQNAGNATDTQVTRMLVNERLTVTVPAGTKMYLVFTKAASSNRSAAELSR